MHIISAIGEIMAGNLKLFTGNAHPKLANEIAKYLKVKLGKAEVKKFADGESYVNLLETVRNADVFIIQPTCYPANDNLVELLVMIDAAKRASAGKITAVIPFYGYAKQDRKAHHREPITAKLVANLLEKAGADHVLTMDLHADQIQGFFDINLDFLYSSQVLVEHFEKKKLKNLVVVSPDVGSSRRARAYAKRLHANLAIIDKRRPRPNVAEVVSIIGDVKGKNALIVDDELNTGGTLVNAAKALKERGAKDIYVAVAHPVLAGDAVKNLKNSAIKEIAVTNSIPIPKEKQFSKIKVLSIAKIFASAINAMHGSKSVSALLNPAK